MATYQELKGAKIKNYTEDPDNPYVGQLWYNTSTDSLRIRKETLGSAWSSGGELNTRRGEGGSSVNGTQTAALAFGGETPPDLAITEAYNGSTWTELNDLNATNRVQGSAGTQTSALSFGGVPVPTHDETELWNGTNWTEVNDLNTGRRSLLELALIILLLWELEEELQAQLIWIKQRYGTELIGLKLMI